MSLPSRVRPTHPYSQSLRTVWLPATRPPTHTVKPPPAHGVAGCNAPTHPHSQATPRARCGCLQRALLPTRSSQLRARRGCLQRAHTPTQPRPSTARPPATRPPTHTVKVRNCAAAYNAPAHPHSQGLQRHGRLQFAHLPTQPRSGTAQLPTTRLHTHTAKAMNGTAACNSPTYPHSQGQEQRSCLQLACTPTQPRP